MGDRPPGRLIGAGRSADVFDIGHCRVLRRYRDGDHDADREARVMTYVRDHGFPAPEVFDATRSDLVMERLAGATMLEQALRPPWPIHRVGSTLADLHEQLHAIPAPTWLTGTFGEGDAIIHLDLHPLNVLIEAGEPVVIDWQMAQRGPAAADVARSWLILASARPPGTLQRAAASLVRPVVLRGFLARYDRSTVTPWLPGLIDDWTTDSGISERERAAARRLGVRLGLAPTRNQTRDR